MPEQIVNPSARRPLLALLALIGASLAAPLAADLGWQVADPNGRPSGLSANAGWAFVMLGSVGGVLAGLLLGPRWPRLAMPIAAVVSAGGVLIALWLTLPGQAIGAPGCGGAPAPGLGQWHVAAETSVDGRRRDGLALDIQPLSRSGEPLFSALLTDLSPVAVEDLGIAEVDGDSVHARHCRALVSGSQITAALPLLANGAGLGGEPLVPANLPVWRGDFDWWVSVRGELVGASVRVGGHPNDAWSDAEGNHGLLVVDLRSPAMQP